MIIGITCWTQQGRVTAMVTLDYDLQTGIQNLGFYRLSVLFDSAGPFENAGRYRSRKINVPLPEVAAHDGPKLDVWLRMYAKDVNNWIGTKPAPKPKAER